MKNSVKIIIGVSLVLLIGVICLFIFASRNKTADAEPVETENTNLNTLQENTDINIVPMAWWNNGIIELAAGTPGLQLTKNNHATDISSGSYVNGSWGAIMANADKIRMQEVNGNVSDYTPSADRLTFSRSVNGWYSLWAVQKNILGQDGKITDEQKVGLDTVRPVLTLYSNGAVATNGSTVGVNVYATATDEFSGVNTIWVLRPGYSSYAAHYGSALTASGTYYFYVTDRAGNSSATQSVTLDKTPPSVQFFGGTTELSNNTYTNADYLQILASDSQTGLDAIYIRQPGASIYVAYTQGSVTFTLEGTYSFYAKDKGGNMTSVYTVTIDRTKPNVTVQYQGVSVGNGVVINRANINVYYTDAGPSTIYYKLGSSSTTYTASYGAAFTAENKYTFWAVDAAGNKSDEYVVTLDRTAPAFVLYAGGTSTTAVYTNKANIMYVASDANAFTVYVQEPGKASYTTGTNSKTYTAEGMYYFYAVDAAGNSSSIRSIRIDRTKPYVKLWANETELSGIGYANTENIKMTIHDDSGSGVNTIYALLPGSTSYVQYYSPASKHYDEGRYSFYCIDMAGNISDTRTVYLDRTIPVGKLYSEGIEVASGRFLNKTFSYTATDDFVGISYLQVKKPGNSIWVSYSSGTAMDGADGTYTFRAVDFSGNISAESTVVYDKTIPVVEIAADNIGIASGNYTNAANVSFMVFDSNVGSAYIKKPGQTSFVLTAINTLYTEEGRYEFYAADLAGNQSPVSVITIDWQIPIGVITANGQTVSSGSYVNAAFKFSATDSVSGVSKFMLCRPGADWEGYSENASVTGADGWYSFRAYDVAGNMSDTYEVYYDTTKPIIKGYAEGDEISSVVYVNADYIFFHALDVSINKLYVKLPGASGYILAIAGEEYTYTGRYEYYAVDNAGNISDIFILTVDRQNPAGNIFSNEISLTNSTVINTPFVFMAEDDFGVNRMEYKNPDGSWTTYDGSTLSDIENGRYTFRAIDNAGNISAEYYIIYDTIMPVVIIFDGNSPLLSGGYTNTQQLRFMPEDVNFHAGYIKLPGESEFTECINGLTFSAEGYYEYYAVDRAGNMSEVCSITIDKTIPIGYLSSVGDEILNGSYTNKPFSYNAIDAVSGIAYLELKRPGREWERYDENIQVSGADGTYYFRAVSNAGNISTESVVYYDTTLPDVKIFAGSETVLSGSQTGVTYIRFTATDTNLYACYILLPDEIEYQVVSSGLQYTQSGLYSFYAEDKAGNVSAIFTVTLDKVGPVGTITVNGSAVTSGTYTNQSFSYSGTDELSAVARCEIKRPGSAVFEAYEAGTIIPSGSDNGTYVFRCYDAVGNVSAETVIYLDSVAPTGQLYANETETASGTFTNALRIKFEGADDNAITCFVKRPGTSAFIQTANGAVYSDAGRYEYYVKDIAGNISETYTITIDRTPKTVTLSNVISGKTEKNVILNWSDTSGFAAILSVTVNGISVTSGAVIKIINGGVYEVKTVDEAGNIWTYSFTAVTTDVLTMTSNKYWWEYKTTNGTVLAFETYEKALAYGIADELSLVKTSVWNNDEWDAGLMMDTVDAVNAKPGTFFIYKKHDDQSTEVAYFTLERLNAVAKSYAESRITKYFYYEKSPAESAEGNNLYSLSDSNIVIAKSVSLNTNAKYFLDGEVFDGDKITDAGKHTLTVYDDFGNSYDYTVYIITATPELYFRDANGDYYLATNDQPYYLKNRFTIKLTDALDEYATVLVLNSNGDIIYRLDEGGEYIISETGKYVIRAINHFGQTDYVFYISANLPKITTTESDTDKRLNVSITASGDKDIYLTLIQIEYSADGDVWGMLPEDDYGNVLKADRLIYNFFKTGWYRITIEDTCRSGIDKITTIVYYEKPAPEGKFTGLGDNGYTNQNVSFSWTDEAYATVAFNGETTNYMSGSVIDLDGEYVLSFYDYDGFKVEYSFIIDKHAPETILSKDITNGYATENLSASWNDGDVTATLYRDGELIGEYISGDSIDIDGSYKIKLVDLAGNETVITFILDTTAPVITLNGIENGGSTKGIVKLSDLPSDATFKLYHNDNEISYRLGENITELGLYRVVVTDAAGNQSEYHFEILYSYNAGSIIVIVLAVLLAGGGTAAIIIMRKRKRFKAKK